jgi:hypothetical protein
LNDKPLDLSTSNQVCPGRLPKNRCRAWIAAQTPSPWVAKASQKRGRIRPQSVGSRTGLARAGKSLRFGGVVTVEDFFHPRSRTEIAFTIYPRIYI